MLFGRVLTRNLNGSKRLMSTFTLPALDYDYGIYLLKIYLL